MKAGYFISSGDGELGFAVVAESETEAKAAVHEAGWLEDDNDLECLRLPAANIEGLPLGMVEDERDALCRGLYDFLREYECDECGQDADVTCHEGRALCEDCLWDAMTSRAINISGLGCKKNRDCRGYIHNNR